MTATESPILLILDLDETLIHATAGRLALPPDFAAGPYSVYKRPGLAAFLETVARDYQLAECSLASVDNVRAIEKRNWRSTARALVAAAG